jgi:hypothetical protein
MSKRQLFLFPEVICWTLRSLLVHFLESGAIALERPLINPFQGWGYYGCQDFLRQQILILHLSGQHNLGDELHLVNELLEV